MRNLAEQKNFIELSIDEYRNIEGGLLITGSMVVAAVICLASGVAVGYAIGTIIEYFVK